MNKAKNTLKNANGRSFSNYFRYGTSKSVMWQFFNPTEKNWEFLKINNEPVNKHTHSIILRNGWVLRKIVRRGEAPFFYECEDGKLSPITRDEAIRLGYESASGYVYIPAVRKKDFFFIDIRNIYFPRKVFKKLTNLADDSAKRRNKLAFIRFKIHCLHEISCLLFENGIKLSFGPNFIDDEYDIEKDNFDLGIDVSITLPEILESLYSKYLKKEQKIEKILITMLKKDWDGVEDEKLRKNLKLLSTKAEDGNTVAKGLLKYLSDYMADYFDWKYYNERNIDSQLTGMIIKTSQKTYGSDWSSNYYKIVFPDLETILFLQTTLSPTRRGIGEFDTLRARLRKISIEKWRIYKYLGKIKNTGTRDEISFEDADVDFQKRSFLSIIGIPTFEWLLNERGCMTAFKFDTEEWKGTYFLNRYFLCNVQIIKPLEIDAQTPQTLVRDIFDNHFHIRWDIDTYLFSSDQIHNLGKGGWLSILLKNAFGKSRSSDLSYPVFDTVKAVSLRFVSKEDAIKNNLVALIKYFGYLPHSSIQNLFRNHPLYGEIMDALDNIIEEDRALREDGNLYYIYQCLEKDSTEKLIDLIENPDRNPDKLIFNEKWYMTWALIRGSYPLVHPMTYANKILVNKELNVSEKELENYLLAENFVQEMAEFHTKEINKRRKKRMNFLINAQKSGLEFNPTFVGKRKEDVYLSHASLMIENFGCASIRARGIWIPKAHKISKLLVRKYAFMEPKVLRTDDIVINSRNNRIVRTVTFEVETYGI